ncbi:hypothetical protein F4604DRAFT_2023153 [Suillus subluteus]|nr:hypothetical protein F4604DRAFT_2023153 [Suillus subluteus]
MSQHVTHLVDTARNPKSHTNYCFLGLVHMQDLAKGYADQTRQLKLQGLNDSRKYMHALTPLDDYQQLLMAISEKDIPCLQQIVNVVLHNGASIQEIVNKLEDALGGIYRPQGYRASDLDIATLVFRLGGSQLLFALNHSLGLPSICTLCTRVTFTKITPTIGPIRNEQLDENILSVMLKSRTNIMTPHGVSLMINEIALEEMAVHFSKYNKVTGLCWKHSHLIDPVLRTYQSAVTIAQKIHDGEVHLGKELTVTGVTCFSEDELYPILAAHTCKTEDAGDMEGVLACAIERWNVTRAATVGPLWSFAIDSDAMHHAAGHRLFLKTPLSTDSQLYGVLSNMPGLNTLTGFCTLIRSPAGIVLNNGHVINAMMLSRYLIWLPAYDKVSVTKLLHPDDPQDVPQAIELMQAIVEFSKSQHSLLNDSFSTNVNTREDLISITLLSHLIESILVPFINTKLSLSEQVQSLSCYAHLAFTIFHGVMFSIAKQQVLDSYVSFFPRDCGDDRLELMFGRSRMIGGHNSGCLYAQALDHLGAAKDIDGVFKRNPELDPGHQCLSLGKQIEDVDHINRLMWKGDIVSGRCDLPSVWRQGREMAVTILTVSQINPINYSYTDLFHDPGMDMLRPLGMDKYFGIVDKEREDSSRVPKTLPTVPIPLPSQLLETVLPWLPCDESGEIQGPGIDEDDGDELMLTFEEMLVAGSGSDMPSFESLPSPTDPSAPMPLQGQGIHPDNYLLYKGHWIHKQTICRLIINKDFESKSSNRLERVHGYTKVNKWIDMRAGHITDHNSFPIGNLFVTILCTARTLSIRILHSTGLFLNDVSRASMNCTIMKASQTTAKISGQLLTVVPTRPSTNPEVPISFLWDGGYVKAQSSIPGTSESTERIVITTWQVPHDALVAACELLWAKALEAKLPLKSIACVNPSDAKLFPYQLADGTPAVVSIEASNLLTASKGEWITVCPLCEAKVANMRSHIGQHILRALSNTPENVSLKEPVGNVLPCGFCGRSGLLGCSITIKVPASGPPVWETKCIYQHTFKYGFAETGSKNKPCWNVPLKCALCYPTLPPEPGKSMRRTPVVSIDAVWRYNMVDHILNEHKEYSVPGRRVSGVALLAVVWMDVKLTELEQSASRIVKERWQVGQEGDK